MAAMTHKARECHRCYGDGCPSCEYAGQVMVFVYAQVTRELHHRIPQCLLTLRDKADAHADIDGMGIQLWMDYEWECYYHGIDPNLDRDTLAGMIERSTYWMTREDHRSGHSEDFRRWGELGGRETCRRYGKPYFRLLALCRWNKATPEELAAYREKILINGS